jgi:N6-adenosine-specific RNA methylase IME4
MSPIHHVVYADPPWSFATYSHKGKGRSAEAYYNCMSLADIEALPVGDWTAADSVLLLWATDPMLPQALEVIRAWGFTYKTVGFYWVKASERFDRKPSYFTGMGYWTRANPEQCLLATRGHPVRWNRDVRKLIISPRREHSRKPDEIYERIERLCPGPYLELFARNTRGGWSSWGDQVDIGSTERRWASNSHPPAQIVAAK